MTKSQLLEKIAQLNKEIENLKAEKEELKSENLVLRYHLTDFIDLLKKANELIAKQEVIEESNKIIRSLMEKNHEFETKDYERIFFNQKHIIDKYQRAPKVKSRKASDFWDKYRKSYNQYKIKHSDKSDNWIFKKIQKDIENDCSWPKTNPEQGKYPDITTIRNNVKN